MDTKAKMEYAVKCKHSGFNCAQAVLKAYQEETGLSDEQVKEIGAGFAGGMGCMQSTCGAVIGAAISAGIMSKGNGTVMTARSLLTDFTRKSGASICGDLKGITTGKVVCECDDCIRNAIEILDSYK